MTRRQFSGNEENLTNRTVSPEQRLPPGTTGQQSQGSSTVDQVKQKAGQAVDQVEQKASQLTDQAKQQASQLTDQAKQQATSQLASQKQRATDTLGGVAQALRQTGQQLREQDRGMIAQYTDKAAQQLDRFSGSLRDKDINQFMSETERFARREPALFLGGAFLVGLLGARFLKSSSQPDQSSGGGTPSTGRHASPPSSNYRPAAASYEQPFPSGRLPATDLPTPAETLGSGSPTLSYGTRGTEER